MFPGIDLLKKNIKLIVKFGVIVKLRLRLLCRHLCKICEITAPFIFVDSGFLFFFVNISDYLVSGSASHISYLIIV